MVLVGFQNEVHQVGRGKWGIREEFKRREWGCIGTKHIYRMYEDSQSKSGGGRDSGTHNFRGLSSTLSQQMRKETRTSGRRKFPPLPVEVKEGFRGRASGSWCVFTRLQSGPSEVRVSPGAPLPRLPLMKTLPPSPESPMFQLSVSLILKNAFLVSPVNAFASLLCLVSGLLAQAFISATPNHHAVFGLLYDPLSPVLSCVT